MLSVVLLDEVGDDRIRLRGQGRKDTEDDE